MFKLLNNDVKAYTFIVIVASLLFIPFIGNVPLFDWDEINFAECAREMVVSHNYSDVQLYFQPFWEKPPLFIWLQALSMNVFGVSEFSARFPNALCGVITLLVLYRCGKTLNDYKFGLTWAFVYASTLLPHLFFKSGIIDPWFNLFIFSSVYFLIQHTNNPVGKFGFKTALLAGFFLGLALLTKGPAALILVGLTVVVFFVLSRFKKISSPKFVALFFLSFLLTGLSWFAIEVLKGNSHVIKEFIDYQIRLFNTEDSDHGGPFIYHFVVLLIGCFPSSLLLILAHKKSTYDTPFQKHTKRWLLALFWVVLILFSIVQTKIVHYSSLCYFPLTYLATYAIQKLLRKEFQWKKWLHRSFVVITVLMGIAFIVVGCIHFFKSYILDHHLIGDEFAVENFKADVYWSGFEWLIGAVFLVSTLYWLYQIKQGKHRFIYGLFFTSLLTIYSLIMFIVPKIEQYSQHAAIEFYKMCGQRQYGIEALNFKSYGTLFYGQITNDIFTSPDFPEFKRQKQKELVDNNMNPETNSGYILKSWLIWQKIHQPACFVAKCTEKDLDKNYPMLKELYRKNGYVFLVRFPEK
jgi:4-amino-4-deoxy-L-arabinose transferase-like glycosyltransferase